MKKIPKNIRVTRQLYNQLQKLEAKEWWERLSDITEIPTSWLVKNFNYKPSNLFKVGPRKKNNRIACGEIIWKTL